MVQNQEKRAQKIFAVRLWANGERFAQLLFECLVSLDRFLSIERELGICDFSTHSIAKLAFVEKVDSVQNETGRIDFWVYIKAHHFVPFEAFFRFFDQDFRLVAMINKDCVAEVYESNKLLWTSKQKEDYRR